jgi:hypothetical protein
MAAFFDRVKTRKTEQPGETIVYAADSGETKQPRTGKAMKPWLPTGTVDADAAGDRRATFTDWLVSPGNPFFARVEANRIWSQFFARGIVDPVDEFRDSNPPSNAALLDALAREFADGGFDRKRLIRMICTSQTYQASCRTSPLNRDDALYFSHQQPRLLGAEQLLDAIDQVTEESGPTRFIVLGPHANPQDLPETLGIDGTCHEQGDIANLARPAALHDNPIEVQIGMLARDGTVPPDIDLGVDLLVQVRDRGRAHPDPPKGFGDILHTPDRYTGQVHLDQRFLDRRLAASVTLNDGCFKDLLA